MEDVLVELSITAVPMVAFWDGMVWDRVILGAEGDDVFPVLNSHCPH